MTKRYFRHDAESDVGVGLVFFEITDGWPSRQIEVYGETWRWGDTNNPFTASGTPALADQPLDKLDLQGEHEISGDEFERLWSEALKRCPRRS